MKILTNGWGETLIKPMQKYLPGVYISKLSDCVNYHDYNSFSMINKVLKSQKFDIVHMNAWFDIFLFTKKKGIKYIYESHSLHPGVSFYGSLSFAEKWSRKMIIIFFYPLFKLLFILQIQRVDIYYISIPGLRQLTETYKSIWLPNPIDMSIFKKRNECYQLEGNVINIFYPTSLRSIKNPVFAFQILENIITIHPNVKIYLIRQAVSNFQKYKKQLDHLEKYIQWLDPIKREDLPFYYSAPWDLVLGSFSDNPHYAILNMIELEAMACQSPIIAHDLYEIIKCPLSEIQVLVIKIITNQSFREKYVKNNFEYVNKIHSMENVAKLYQKHISKFIH